MNTYNYIFWHNPYEELWYAIPRDQQLLFFNGNRKEAKGVWSDKKIDKLVKKVNND